MKSPKSLALLMLSLACSSMFGATPTTQRLIGFALPAIPGSCLVGLGLTLKNNNYSTDILVTTIAGGAMAAIFGFHCHQQEWAKKDVWKALITGSVFAALTSTAALTWKKLYQNN